MSVLSFPRLHFRGFMEWDPGLTNNSGSHYDPVLVEVILPPGVTHEQFKRWIIENDFGNWNVYGTHRTAFVQHGDKVSVVTGGSREPARLVTDDPIVGARLRLDGRLVDLDPRGLASQIFFDSFSIVGEREYLRASRHVRMHSRWITFTRNLGGLPIAGGAGVVWQTVFPNGSFALDSKGSALLASFEDALARPEVRGLMLRFSAYRTLYFQNGIFNSIRQQPRSITELHGLYQQRETFSNPAYSVVVGTVGLWLHGEPMTMPSGRLLVPTPSRRPVAPAVAEFDRTRGLLSIDLGNTIPERDRTLEKADHGTLTILAGDVPVATLRPEDYGRSAYETRAGIVDVDTGGRDIATEPLTVTSSADGTTLLQESEFNVVSDAKNIYLDEGDRWPVTWRVLHRGVQAPAGTMVVPFVFPESSKSIRIEPSDPVPIDGEGTATFYLSAVAPGFVDVAIMAFANGTPVPSRAFDLTSGFFLSARALPFDDALAEISDAELRWELVYERVLRVFDLTSPVMGTPMVGLPLADPGIWTLPNMAARLKAATDKSAFESLRYMPVTRALSKGKRELLRRWCDAVLSSAAPEARAVPTLSKRA